MNNFKTAILLTLMSMLLMSIGGALGGQSGVITMFVVSLGMNFISYWYSDKMVLKMYGAKEATEQEAPEFFKLVANLAQKAELPMPKVYIIDTDVPNAFATGRNPSHAAVAATKGIMQVLSYEELEGVMAHELSHVKHRDTLIGTVSASLAAAIAMIAKMGFFFGGNRDSQGNNNGLVGLLMLIVAPMAATVIQMAISRSREYMADESGARISGKPLALASALNKIESYAQRKVLPAATPETTNMFIINPLSGVRSSFSGLFSTHPKTADRIAQLQKIAQTIK